MTIKKRTHDTPSPPGKDVDIHIDTDHTHDDHHVREAIDRLSHQLTTLLHRGEALMAINTEILTRTARIDAAVAAITAALAKGSVLSAEDIAELERATMAVEAAVPPAPPTI